MNPPILSAQDLISFDVSAAVLYGESSIAKKQRMANLRKSMFNSKLTGPMDISTAAELRSSTFINSLVAARPSHL